MKPERATSEMNIRVQPRRRGAYVRASRGNLSAWVIEACDKEAAYGPLTDAEKVKGAELAREHGALKIT